MADTRIYKVTQKVGNTVVVRLVDATTPARAIRHIVSDTIEIEVCTARDAAALAQAGATVEVAGNVEVVEE